MVLRHKAISQRKPIFYKPDNPARLHMSKAEVIKENELAKAKAKKLAEAEAKIDMELGIKEPKEEVKVESSKQQEGQSNGERIAELESIKLKIRGPGSKEKKAAIDAEIAKLKSQS